MTDDVVVRPMTAADLAEATRIYRLAFGTFLQAPHPGTLRPEVYVLGGWR